MSRMQPTARSPRALTYGITAVLGAAAMLYLGYQLWLAFDPDDTGRMETTLVLSVVGQLRRGFGSLYGPFDGSNPLVIIHAPLYYRLAAILTWPLARLGLDDLGSALAVGRLLSAAGTMGLLVVAAALARLDGAPRRAGLWAAFLIAASPVLGILIVMVRPDTVAVLMQTAGVLLVLRAIRDGGGRLGLAYALFALAFCAKQHSVFAAAVTTAILGIACWRGRIRLAPIVAAHAIGAAVGLGYLAGEDILTGGRMSHSVFVLPGGPFRAINYATWGHVAAIGLITAKKSIGLLALAGALALYRLAGGRPRWPGWVDASLWAYLAVELAMFVPLCLFNQGAADNYALQAVVFAAVLIGRGLGRATFEIEARVPARAWRLAPIAVAALIVLGRDVQMIGTDARIRRADRDTLAAVFHDPAVADLPPRSFYFTNLPQHNRVHGRSSLAHDEWLYAAFESVGAAESRESWLAPALASGPIRVVVADATDTVPGLAESLEGLGYERVAAHGPYHVWRRDEPTAIASQVH